jgi:hypothetical protein
MSARVLVLILLGLAAPASAAGPWEHKAFKDEMTNVSKGNLYLLKSEPQSFAFPYQAPAPAGLGIRHFDDGIELIWYSPGAPPILHAEGARISVDGVLLGLGGRFELTAPTSGNHSTAFIAVSMLDVARIAGAKSVKVELLFFQAGSRVFTFAPTAALAGLPSFAPTKAVLDEAITRK